MPIDIIPNGQNVSPYQPYVDTPSNAGELPEFIIDDNVLNFTKFTYPTTGVVVSKVAVRAIQNNVAGSDQHRAMDISAPKDTPVYSSTDGTVERIGANGYGPNAVYIKIDPSFYNNPAQASNNGRWIIYGHLDKATVKIGTKVKVGQLIGNVGDKGSPGRFHLHFQIRNIAFGYDQSGLSVNINKNFPLKGKNITAKQNFIA